MHFSRNNFPCVACFRKLQSHGCTPCLRQQMTRLSLASGMTSIRGGSTCKAPSPPRNTTCSTQGTDSECQKVASKLIAHTYTLTCRACEELTRLCRISSLANSNEQEEMSIRFFNSAYEHKSTHISHTYHQLFSSKKLNVQAVID